MTQQEAVELVTLTIDGTEVSVPKGTMIIRAAEKIGVRIPRFCDHPLLKPAGACRQCLVEVARPGRDGTIAKMPKPVASCAEAVSPGMEVYTQHTSDVARVAQHGIMEFLLINHPMDCPICDKGGECPLQNQAMTEGRASSRFVDIKRTYPKPIEISSQILLDRDRCILCQRCTRFQSQIAGDRFIQLQGRGGGHAGYEVGGLNGSQIGNFDARVLNFADDNGDHGEATPSAYVGPFGTNGIQEGYSAGPLAPAEKDEAGRPFASYFSGNIIQICPVGALTSQAYRFRARPFDLVSVPSVAEHDASGSAIRVDYRRGVIVRRLSGEDPQVNEEWITDKDRFAFTWQHGEDRLKSPLVRDENGELVPTSWPDALDVAARALTLAKGEGIGVLTGGRLTMEDAYAYSKFARTVLSTNNVDLRTRVASEEEDAFLGACVAGTGLGVTYTDLEKAGHVLTVGFEAEEECGTVFLRLRKGYLAKSVNVSVIAPYATAGSAKMGARVIDCVPGDEAAILDALSAGDVTFDALSKGGVIIVGERLGQVPGGYSAALRLSERTGARLVWIPRRAGERAGLDMGLLPTLLPGGRQVADGEARADMAAFWDVESLPSTPGLNTQHILSGAASGDISTLILAGVGLNDLGDNARDALKSAQTVIQFEVRRNEISEYADVVFPVAPPSEKGGSFVNWEGRIRPFGQVLTSVTPPDRTVLNDLALAMGTDMGLARLEDVVKEINALGTWDGARASAPTVASTRVRVPSKGAVLASWNLMLGAGSMQDFEPHLAGTARKAVAVMSPQTAAAAGINAGEKAEITGPSGSLVLDVALVPMPQGVVWVPENSVGASLTMLGARAGQQVAVSAARVEVAQ